MEILTLDIHQYHEPYSIKIFEIKIGRIEKELWAYKGENWNFEKDKNYVFYSVFDTNYSFYLYKSNFIG